MDNVIYEADQLGVDPAWLLLRMRPIGIGRCPSCFPDMDIIREGNYIEPCSEHSGILGSLESPDDQRVTAPIVDIMAAERFV